MSGNGNGRLRRWATIGTIAVACILVGGFAWARLRGVVKATDNLTWLEEHRAEVPDLLRANEEFQAATRRFQVESIKRDDQAAAELKQLRDLLAQSIGLNEANQDLLFQVLTLKHREMGLPPPKKKTVFFTPIMKPTPPAEEEVP
jgi:hypothetical protein